MEMSPLPDHSALSSAQSANSSDDVRIIHESVSEEAAQVQLTLRDWLQAPPVLDTVNSVLAAATKRVEGLSEELGKLRLLSDLSSSLENTTNELARLSQLTRLMETTSDVLNLVPIVKELPVDEVLARTESLLERVEELREKLGAEVDDVSDGLKQKLDEQKLLATERSIEVGPFPSGEATGESIPAISQPVSEADDTLVDGQAVDGVILPGGAEPIPFMEGVEFLVEQLQLASQLYPTMEQVEKHLADASEVHKILDSYLIEQAKVDPEHAKQQHLQMREEQIKMEDLDKQSPQNLGEFLQAAQVSGVANVVRDAALVSFLLSFQFQSKESSETDKIVVNAEKTAQQLNNAAVYPHFVFLLLQGPKSSAEVTGKDLLLQKEAIFTIYQALESARGSVGSLTSVSDEPEVQRALTIHERDTVFGGLIEQEPKLQSLLTTLETLLPEDKVADLHALRERVDEEAVFLRQAIFKEHLRPAEAIAALTERVPTDLGGTLEYVARLKDVNLILENAQMKLGAHQLDIQYHTVILNGSVVGIAKGLHDLLASASTSFDKERILDTYAFVLKHSR